jgi:aspartate racemase
VAIWRELLRVERIGIRDNFFDLGGDSLTATRLIVRVEAAFGRRLPLSVIIQASTIERLAEVVDQPSHELLSSLVRFSDEGSRQPFFCVHGHDGNVLVFRDLARLLGPDQPFYGLQSQGLDGSDVRYQSVEQIAAHYLSEVTKRQPQGPYFLGGFCSGGVIAFEMARQLDARAEKVALLTLIDAYGPGYPKSLPLASRLWHEISHHASDLADLRVTDLWSYVSTRAQGRIKGVVAALQKKIWRLISGSYLAFDKPLNGSPRNVAELNLWAIRRYQPGTYHGRVAVFHAQDQPAWCYPDPNLGWAKFVTGGLEVVEVPHDRNAMLHSDLFAGQLRKSLIDARRRTDS